MNNTTNISKILLSGFEPFYTHTINVSQKLVCSLGDTSYCGHTIQSTVLPVVQQHSIEDLIQEIETCKPSAVIALGQSNRTGISLERTAHNLDHFRIPDNAGNKPPPAPVVKGGPLQYPSTLPLEAWYKALTEQDIPVHFSDTAGTFVCNHLFYGLQHYLRDSNIPSGFIHVPMLPEQTTRSDSPSLPFKQQLLALKTMIRVLVNPSF